MWIRPNVCLSLLGLLLVAGCGTARETAVRNNEPDATNNQTAAQTSENALPKESELQTGEAEEVLAPEVPAPEANSRVAVGDPAPGFRLRDQDGQEHSLEDLLENGKVALVFYRSADW
jgi:hypothetical protein